MTSTANALWVFLMHTRVLVRAMRTDVKIYLAERQCEPLVWAVAIHCYRSLNILDCHNKHDATYSLSTNNNL